MFRCTNCLIEVPEQNCLTFVDFELIGPRGNYIPVGEGLCDDCWIAVHPEDAPMYGISPDSVSPELCSRCGDNYATEPHPCPFAQEINDDDTMCTCCEACTNDCADDI